MNNIDHFCYYCFSFSEKRTYFLPFNWVSNFHVSTFLEMMSGNLVSCIYETRFPEISSLKKYRHTLHKDVMKCKVDIHRQTKKQVYTAEPTKITAVLERGRTQ